jgi:hypothetical protein
MFIKSKAQGILEYTIMLAAIVAIIVVVMLKSGGVGTNVKSSYLRMGEVMNNTVTDLTNTISPSK